MFSFEDKKHSPARKRSEETLEKFPLTKRPQILGLNKTR